MDIALLVGHGAVMSDGDKEEVWKDISGHSGYEVSSLGRLRTFWWLAEGGGLRKRRCLFAEWSLVPSFVDRDGYLRARIRTNSEGPGRAHRWVRRSVHVLVLTAFHGPKPTGCLGSHLNGDPADNRAANLVWETQRENLKRRDGHGTDQKGMRASGAKLTDEEVQQIRWLSKNRGVSQRKLALTYRVTQPSIGYLLLRQTWKQVEDLPRDDAKMSQAYPVKLEP